MYLKSIEVQGFKSFAHKLVFEFHDGITGIVGPNGSGKSNVADAVRWVLGEQSSKQLRGSKMQDIIFAGTENRKALSFAYVAITLDNTDHKLATDYEEVTVARRLYRSGESEYLLNGVACRLKDVQELFFDTGIGKEGYSIIGQGQIDKILSGKPDERRELFDEAAGIVKFKKRKETAERDLQAEHSNLDRVTDILTELEKQVGPLEKQSEVAKEYLKLKEELKALDITMFVQEFDTVHTQLEEVRGKQELVTKDLEHAKEEFEKAKLAFDELDQQVETQDASLESMKNERNESLVKQEQLEGDIKVYQEQITAATQNEKHYEERVAQVQKNCETSSKQLAEFVEEKKALESKIEEISRQQNCAQEDLQTLQQVITQLEAEQNDCSRYRLNFLQSVSDIRAEQEKCEAMLEQNTLKKAELNQRILGNQSEMSLAKEELEEQQKELELVLQGLEETKNKTRELLRQKQEMDRILEQCRTEYQEEQRHYHVVHSKLESLKNIAERYEGYGQSIRRIMECKEANEGIVGVVADLIHVEQKYETAIETALGGSIQNVVTDNEQTAKSLISFLKKNRYGRATFLPLTSIHGKNAIPAEVLKESGVIGCLATLVDCDKKYENLALYLLGRFVLVDQIDHALILAKKYHHSLRIVTLEGELLNPGGSLSGGAYKNGSNLLGRRREMEDLQKEEELCKKTCEKLVRDTETAKKKRESILIEISRGNGEMEEAKLRENTCRIKMEQAKLNHDNSELAYRHIKQDGMEIEKQRQILNEAKEGIVKRIEDAKQEDSAKEHRLDELTGLLEQHHLDEEKARETVSHLAMEMQSYVQSGTYLEESVQRVTKEHLQHQTELEELSGGKMQASEQIRIKEEAIDAVKEAIANFKKRANELEGLIGEKKKEREAITLLQRESITKREEFSNLTNDLDKEAFRLNNQLDKLTEQLDSQIDYMWNEYELTYHSAKDMELTTDRTMTQMKKEAAECRSRIRHLGPVNVNAIEDYKNVSERYETMHKQHSDIIQAEEVLMGIIHELDEEMRKQFSEKFIEIREQFDKVFKELFGGGKANIELMEDEDILEAGIQIIAQPPGKALKNMMQLSGGEKALTAISLLFAIQNLKPSPFCLLDEIEAALDDSNVKRFAKYLHKLTKNTQFIVITHRQGTMAAADTLYGITMQEKGVSTLVSVNLIEDQLTQ